MIFFSKRIGFAAGFCLFMICTAAFAARPFDPLFRIISITAPCQVRLPGAGAFEPAREGRAYPYGSTVDVGQAGSATVLFSRDDYVTLRNGALATIESDGTPSDQRILVRFDRGNLEYSVREAIGEENRIRIISPTALVERISGRGELTLDPSGELYRMSIRPRTGAIGVGGGQFSITRLRTGMIANISMAHDRSYTAIANQSGDFVVTLASGDDQPVEVSTTPRAIVKLWRQHAPVGGRLIVSVLAVGADGRQTHRFAYASDTVRDPGNVPYGLESADASADAAIPTPEAEAIRKINW